MAKKPTTAEDKIKHLESRIAGLTSQMEMLLTTPGLTPAQRAQKPPVSQPVVLRHPLSGRRCLYANPGYAMRIDGWDPQESDEVLAFLFEHQLRLEYRYAHSWAEGDVLLWDDLCTIHNAVADYGADEPRHILRCQVMADKVLPAARLA